jgi:hypothetical protein
MGLIRGVLAPDIATLIRAAPPTASHHRRGDATLTPCNRHPPHGGATHGTHRNH